MSRQRAVAVEFPCERPEGWRDRWRFWRAGVDRPKSVQALATIASIPILACVGGNGGGKSLAAVYVLLPTLRGTRWQCYNPDHLHTHGDGCASRRLLSTEPTEVCDCATTWERTDNGSRVLELAEGARVEGMRRVLSTVELRDLDDTSRVSPYYERLRSFVQLLGVEHTDVLMDEVTGIASARQSMSLPVQVENLVQQLRRCDARLIWTTPDYGNADLRIRSVTKGVVLCRGRWALPPAAGDRSPWSRRARLFRWSLYDPTEFDRFTAGKRASLLPSARAAFWRPGHVAERAYDTNAAVTQLGAASEGGLCFTCGGRRSAPQCTCPTDPDRLPLGVAEVITPSGGRRRVVQLVGTSGEDVAAGAAGRRVGGPAAR